LQISLLKQVWLNLWSAKLRSGLALLGVMIGVAAVVALVSGGQMAAKNTVDKLKAMGTNLLSVSIYNRGHSVKTKGFSDAELAVFSSIAGVKQVVANINLSADITMNNKTIYAALIGISPEMLEIAKIELDQGRLFTHLDDASFNCLVGKDVANMLQANGVFSVVGAWLNFKDNYCQVVGVIKPWPSNFFIMADFNRSVILPLSIAKTIAEPSNIVSSIVIETKQGFKLLDVQEKITSLIKQLKPGMNVSVRNPEELINQVESQQQTFTILLGFIGSIALVVGGIGIMNVMLASLAERKYEIGLRMAIGASGGAIQKMFLLESVLLSLVGGLLGAVLGVVGSWLIASFSGWEFVLFATPIFLGVFISSLVGVFFGFYPAYQASILDPIVVLRGID
jgi:putative ABC transport system permease protein